MLQIDGLCDVCDFVDDPNYIAMDRLSPWNKLKVKFSPFSENKSARIQSKRAKTDPKRQKISFIQKTTAFSKNDETSSIDDSNEENVQHNEIDISSPLPKPKKMKFVPLNSSLLHTPCKSTNSRRKSTARRNGYGKIVNTSSIRKDDVESSSVCDDKVTTPNPKQKTPTPIGTHVAHIKNIFDGTRVTIKQAALEDSIIAADSEDDDDDNRRRSTVVANTSMPLTRLDLDHRPASQVTIESVSSFGSIQYLSQRPIAPMQKSQKRPKVVKGGLTELLQRSISKAKSDHAFWLNDRQMTAPGERVLIEKIDRDCGRILVHCVPLNGHNDDVKIFCLDPDSKRLSSLGVGKSIEVEFNTNEYRLDSHTICYPNVTNILL